MMDLRFYYSLILGLLLWSCQQPEEETFFVIQGQAQGSTYSIKYIAKEELVSKIEIDSLLEAFDNSLSTYKPTSKIAKVNSGDTTIVVDKWFTDTFNASQKIYKETNGLFDPTIGVLVNAYGFGPGHQHHNLSQYQIDSLLQYVGFSKVKISPSQTIHKDFPQTYFDFNAIAQGYSVDVTVGFLKSKGIQDAIVEIGGELFAIGKNTIQDKNWIVGIDDPLQTPEERKLIATIAVENLGMATSGNYRKVITDSITGEKFVHTINPKTGKPQKSNVLSATVLASTCMMADGYATAFMVMSLEQGKEFLKKHPELYVMIMYADENNKLQQLQTENFKLLLK